jgi:hypothetical protein
MKRVFMLNAAVAMTILDLISRVACILHHLLSGYTDQIFHIVQFVFIYHTLQLGMVALRFLLPFFFTFYFHSKASSNFH